MIDLDLKPDDNKLRQFAWVALFGFGILGAATYFGWGIFAKLPARQIIAYIFWALAIICPILGLIKPKLVLPVFLGLSIIAFPIGFVLSFVIIGLIFFLMITPIALFFKLTGRDALKRELKPDADTYWDDVEQRDSASYLRQF